MYSRVSKYSPEAQKRMAYRSSRSKSCGYYMRIVFFFSSLIQSLIIVSLVLFLIYGKQQDSASMSRVQDLEQRFSQLSMETVSLRQQRKNLTHLLNVTSMEKARNEWDLAQLRQFANISYMLLDDTEKKLQQCNFERRTSRVNCPPEIRTPINTFSSPYGVSSNCGLQMETLKAKMELIQSNFTQTAMQMQMEMDQMAKDRDNLNLEAIQLRRDKSVHEKAIQFYQIKCKEEFVNSLSGISNVSKAFLGKINSLFHALSPFHLTCPKQKDYLEQIRTNCSDLSEEVVTKFQTYLDTLGDRVSMYQGNISVLTAENMRMTRDYNLCSQNRTGLIREHKQHIQRIQLQNDDEKERLLKEKLKLKGEIDVLENSVKLKNSQLDHMNEQLKHLNLSCIPRGGGLFPRPGSQPGSPWGAQSSSTNPGFPSSSSGTSLFNRNNFGSSSSSSSSGSAFGSNTGLLSSNSGFNKPSSTGLGSSSLGSSSLGANSGLGSSTLNKQSSSNQGSSFGSSSSGTSLNKQTSTGLGSSSQSSSFGSSFGSSNNPSSSSSSSSLNKFGSSGGSGTSSSSLGSNFGSSSSSKFGSPSNSGLGSSSSSSLSKTTTNSRGSSNSFFGSSSSSSSSNLGSSSSSQNKQSSPSSSSSSSSSSGSSASNSKGGFGWWGLGGGSSNSNTNSDQSKLGSSQGRGASNSGSSFGSFGSGRTNTFSFTGSQSVSQHLRDLQRIINPPGPEEKPELSRMLG